MGSVEKEKIERSAKFLRLEGERQQRQNALELYPTVIQDKLKYTQGVAAGAPRPRTRENKRGCEGVAFGGHFADSRGDSNSP